MKFAYFPGCSQKATSRAYEESLLAVCGKLGIELDELHDWNCCGTTTVISVNKVLSLALAARNLALAEPTGLTLVTPCPSCWLSLDRANKVLKEGGELAGKVRNALSTGGFSYEGTVDVRHILELLVHHMGLETIKEKVKRPLTGLRIAPYYGCQVVRPYARGDDADDPQNMERIIEAIGGEVAVFPLRTNCCGGALMATREQLAVRMSCDILHSIEKVGADIIVTPCSLCQVNLELGQLQANKVVGRDIELPVLTITQLIGIAMGIEFKQLGLNRSLKGEKDLAALLEPRRAA